MTWDNSPWAVEGGQTSADVGRLLAWHATNGAYGIAKPTDLRVRAKDVPGGSVLISPGAVTVPCKALGKTLQSYIGSNPTDDELLIPATGSGGGRSDLIVARVENPISGEPWQVPAGTDPLTAPYIFTRRYSSGVTTATTHVNQVDPSASAFTLARIDIPANTGTITQAMITDLRGKPGTGEPPLPSTPMAAAIQDFYYSKAFGRDFGSYEDVLPYTQTTYARWPSYATWQVQVPANATEAVVNIRIECEQRPTSGQPVAKGHAWGYSKLTMEVGGSSLGYTEVEFDKDYYGGGTPTTVTIPIGGTITVPATARGKSATFNVYAAMYNDANTRGRLVICRGSLITCQIHFNVRPTSS